MGKTKKLPDPEPGNYAAWLKQMGDQDGVDFLGLLEKMSTGDRKAADAAVAYMRRRPEVAESVLGHSTTAQSVWLDYAASDPFTRFSLEEHARRMRRELLSMYP